MDPRSQVLLRQAEYFTGNLLLAGAPADGLLDELPRAQLWSWQADEWQKRLQWHAEWLQLAYEVPAVDVEDAGLRLPRSSELTEYLHPEVVAHPPLHCADS